MWDTDNYKGMSDEMYGQFYPEDLGTILQIMHYESESNKRKKH